MNPTDYSAHPPPPPYYGHGEEYIQGNGVLSPLSPQSSSPSAGARIKVAEGFIPPPPIDLSRFHIQEIQSTPFEHDFAYEEEVLKTYKAGGVKVGENGVERVLSEEREFAIVDPWGERINYFVPKGYSREYVSIALAVHPNGEENKVLDFLQKHEQLKQMGFPSEVVTKALICYDHDLQAASESCLSMLS